MKHLRWSAPVLLLLITLASKTAHSDPTSAAGLDFCAAADHLRQQIHGPSAGTRAPSQDLSLRRDLLEQLSLCTQLRGATPQTDTEAHSAYQAGLSHCGTNDQTCIADLHHALAKYNDAPRTGRAAAQALARTKRVRGLPGTFHRADGLPKGCFGFLLFSHAFVAAKWKSSSWTRS